MIDADILAEIATIFAADPDDSTPTKPTPTPAVLTAADVDAFLAAHADDDQEPAPAKRADPVPLPIITGYAAVFYDPADSSTVGIADDGAELRILPTAYRYELGKSRVVSWFDHRPDVPLGSEAAGMLRIAVDARGLRYWLTPPDTRAGRQLVRMIESGEVSGSSCTYCVDNRTERRADGGKLIREVWDVTLSEVGPVRAPRFPGACCWVEQANPDLDEIARFLAVAANLEAQEAQ